MTDVLLTGLRYDELRGKLRARRESLGMTQAELAAKMGSHSSAISLLERGAGHLPTLDTLQRWIRALHMEFGFLVTPREERYEDPNRWDEMA